MWDMQSKMISLMDITSIFQMFRYKIVKSRIMLKFALLLYI